MKSRLLVLIGVLSFGLLSGQSINLLKDIKAGSANGITIVGKAGIAYNGLNKNHPFCRFEA